MDILIGMEVLMPKFEVVGSDKRKEVEADSLEAGAKIVKEEVPEGKVLEVNESEKKILVKDVVTG